MKHGINLITAVLLMLLLSCCVCAATAEWMPGAASPTDLAPVDQKLMLGDTWSDTLEEEQELTGRLRMFYSGTIHLLASGADLTVTAQKEPVYSSSETVWDTDTNTGRLEKAWFAEEGTYLLTVRTKNGKTGAFTLKFLSDKAYQKLMEEEEEARWKLIPLADEELERQGFFQAVVIREEGAALYRSMDGNTVPMQYLPADVLMNLLPMNDEWGKVQLVYRGREGAEEEILVGYIKLNDAAAYLEEEPGEAASPVIRTICITSAANEADAISAGDEIEIKASLYGFSESDRYRVQWQYTPDGGTSWADAENGGELVYRYSIDETNMDYGWRLLLTLLPDEP